MEELLGICAKRSLGSKQEDRKAGNLMSHQTFFAVTLDRKIKLFSSSPEEFKIIEFREFESRFYVVELPSFTRRQYRMQQYKAELKQAAIMGEPKKDYRFKVLLKGKEQKITVKQMPRTRAVKLIIKEFKSLDELHEWYDGDWLLIKKKKQK